jgi:hypothetical protein
MKLEDRINQLKQEIKNLEQEAREQKASLIPEDVKEIATLIHDTICKQNHTDQCSWYYDDGDWSTYPRPEYLKKAQSLLEECSKEDIYKLVEIVKK